MILQSARAHHLDQLMTIASDLLGSLEVEQNELLHFERGLFGFPECRSFVLVGAEKEGLYWLQSAEYSSLTFLLIDPFLHFQRYAVDLSDDDLRELAIEKPGEVSVLAIVTLPASRTASPTANLQGPLALNTRTRAAKQVVMDDEEFGTRCEFSLEAAAGK